MDVDKIWNDKSYDWFVMMAESNIYSTLLARIPPEKLNKIQKKIGGVKTNEFGDNIRLFESLGGTIEKIPKKKKK